MSNRDLLLEFIQWLADNRAAAHDIIEEDDPEAAVDAVDVFLESIGAK